jgi:ADP-ribose pyrophosphatase YjhB (NUDIX family)
VNFCSNCGAPVVQRVPDGDSRPRYVCDGCGMVHYQNPNIVAGCLIEVDGRILLARRAIEPRYGLWTLPAGFMENGETTLQAAMRETLEEAGASVTIDKLYTLFNLPRVNQVYMLYLAHLTAPGFAPGAESLEVELFGEAQIPWDSLAFPTIRQTLEYYVQDRPRGAFPLHCATIVRERDRIDVAVTP